MIQHLTHALPHGISLSCRVSGDVGRPVLMFLHGFPEAAFVWDELLTFFAQPEHGGYRCVAPNLRGYADSAAPAEVSAYRAKHLVADLDALVTALTGSADQPLDLLVAPLLAEFDRFGPGEQVASFFDVGTRQRRQPPPQRQQQQKQ